MKQNQIELADVDQWANFAHVLTKRLNIPIWQLLERVDTQEEIEGAEDWGLVSHSISSPMMDASRNIVDMLGAYRG